MCSLRLSCACLQSLKLTGNYDLHTLGDGLSHLTSLTHLDLCECAAIYGGHPDQAAVVRSTAVNHHGAPQSGSDMSHTLQLLQLPQLAALTNMLRLNLSHNHSLCMLPASISHLTRLTELDVTNCSIRFINDELWACQSLKRLTMACNLMPKLSDNISRLVDLEVRL